VSAPNLLPQVDFDYCVVTDADYKRHPIPAYAGHPFIECLEQYVDFDELANAIEQRPDFAEEQRTWPTVYRGQLAHGLDRLFLALPRTIVVVRTFIDLMMEGYVGREPFNARHHELLNADDRKEPEMAVLAKVKAERAVAFIGVPGTGKSKTVEHFHALYSKPRYHVLYGIWQIPVLIIRFPPDGRSVHSLATELIEAIDAKLPHVGYAEMFLRRGSLNAWERLRHARRLLLLHAVGLIFVEESQDTKYSTSPKPQNSDKLRDIKTEVESPVLSHLIAASNTFGVPLVFMGTNELGDILKSRLSRGRRAAGLPRWKELARSGNLKEPGEFELLLISMWEFQWLEAYVPLTQVIADEFAALTQCNPDVVVKLFKTCQRRAILENRKDFDVAFIRSTFEEYFELVAEALEDIASNDPDALALRPELAPPELRPSRPDFEKVKARMHEQNMREGRTRRRSAP